MNRLSIYRGDTVTIPLVFDDGASTPTPINITGYTIFFTVKRKGDSSDNDDDALITADVSVHTDAVNGLSEITLSAEDTDVEAGDHVYDIQLKTGSGDILTVDKGVFAVANDTTKRSS